jgi:hypothetical protein
MTGTVKNETLLGAVPTSGTFYSQLPLLIAVHNAGLSVNEPPCKEASRRDGAASLRDAAHRTRKRVPARVPGRYTLQGELL